MKDRADCTAVEKKTVDTCTGKFESLRFDSRIALEAPNLKHAYTLCLTGIQSE
jgi:hypothetical protein